MEIRNSKSGPLGQWALALAGVRRYRHERMDETEPAVWHARSSRTGDAQKDAAERGVPEDDGALVLGRES